MQRQRSCGTQRLVFPRRSYLFQTSSMIAIWGSALQRASEKKTSKDFLCRSGSCFNNLDKNKELFLSALADTDLLPFSPSNSTIFSKSQHPTSSLLVSFDIKILSSINLSANGGYSLPTPLLPLLLEVREVFLWGARESLWLNFN